MAEKTDSEEPGPSLTRRVFLTASSTSVALGVTTWPEDATPAPLSDIVIKQDDLVVPPADGYVDRAGQPSDARLVRHLRANLHGFSEEDMALSGFETTERAEAPTHVESAAIRSRGKWTIEDLANAVDGWLNGDDRDAARVVVDDDLGRDTVQWTSRGQDHSLEVFRLRATPPGPVLATVTHGHEDVSVDPESAVDRYEAIMRDRVRV